VTGYQHVYATEFQMLTHSNFINSTNDGGIFYDIDASSDQSGSPVYYCGSENTKLVGIHKSYWPQKQLNFATMITDAVIIVMQGWANELKSSFQVNHDKDNSFSESSIIMRHSKSSIIIRDSKIIKDPPVRKNIPELKPITVNNRI
jgi:hypothetical protein